MGATRNLRVRIQNGDNCHCSCDLRNTGRLKIPLITKKQVQSRLAPHRLLAWYSPDFFAQSYARILAEIRELEK
jgi:hypothetical protein